MYAVIKTGGKQYSVKVGDVVYVEKLNAEADTEVTFDQVLAVGEEGSVKVGAPVVEGATVVAKVVKNGKGKKLNILTYRPKKGSMVRQGCMFSHLRSDICHASAPSSPRVLTDSRGYTP